MRPLTALLLVAACSGQGAPTPANLVPPQHGAVATASFASLVRFGSAASEAASYTTPWADTSRLGDTTFFIRGRVVTTVTVHTDSQWSVRPPVVMGIPSGPSQLPPDSLCTLGYTGTSFAVDAHRVLDNLQRTRDCHGHAFLQLRRARMKDANGYLSVLAAQAELEKWPWSGICPRVQDSTIIAFFIGDDVKAEEWGPAQLPTRLAQWDSIGSFIQARCPGAPIVLRALPTQMEARPDWQWVTTAWAQYPGPRRSGAPEHFFANQIESAKRQHLGLVSGVNLLNGGCGPVEKGWCLPDVPGTAERGTRDELYQLSAAELTFYKTAAMADPYVCASVDWAWGPNFKSNFHDKPEIRNAAKALTLLANKRPVASCVRR